MAKTAASEEATEKIPYHHNSVFFSSMAHRAIASPKNKPFNTAVLQYRQIVKHLDSLKQELHDLENSMEELRDVQVSYAGLLIKINLLWNQFDDDLILLGAQAGGDQRALQSLRHMDHSQDVKKALDLRRSYTLELMKSLEDAIVVQSSDVEQLANTPEGAIILLSNAFKEESRYLFLAIDALHLKHKEYAEVVGVCAQSLSVDQVVLKRLEGELEEIMATLEESRRYLVNLKVRIDAASLGKMPVSGSVNRIVSLEKVADTSKDARELKDSIEETKVLAEDRLKELQDAKENNFILAKKLQDLQAELEDDKFVHSNNAYKILNDHLNHWNAMTERYKVLAESPQADRHFITWREKELIDKAESVDSTKKAINDSESKIEELEHLLQRCITEKNELEIKAEEAIQKLGQEDIKAEFKVISSILSKEAGMVKADLIQWKDTTDEALHLSEEAQSLRASLDIKTAEQKDLASKCARNAGDIKSLEELIEKMERDNQELGFILKMYEDKICDERTLKEIQESERIARSQANILRNSLEEHDVKMGVKAANEAEAAFQKRIFANEAEIAQLQAELEASERDEFELREKLKGKEGEAEARLSDIEVFGQSYEDTMNQNQHLLQMIAERDELCNKLISESEKTKQAQSLLLSTRQALATQLQQSKASLESLDMRMAHSEKQMRDCVLEALNYTLEDRELAVSADTVKLELLNAEKELEWMESVVSSSEKEYEEFQRKMDKALAELETERGEKKKLDDELVELNKTVEESTSQSGEDAVQNLQGEIGRCQAILKCGVCIDRQKEVMIAKCFHTFCYPCIERNLELHHRRCPGCGADFGENDVKFVKF